MFSEAGTINCGVRQGSVSGPLLFLLHINDIIQGLSDSHTYLCADDYGMFFYKYKDVTQIENVLNKKFANSLKWFVHNKLPIHFGEDKTKCILLCMEKTCRKLT